MAQFSESAYSHAVFCELHLKYGISDFMIPSTRSEGLNHLGYDLKALITGDWYFFQFKVPTKVTQARKTSLRTSHPYCFQIRHPQHADLRAISSPHVYYVAPVFDQSSDLATNFQEMNIEDTSMAVELSSHKFDNKEITRRHYLTYDDRTFEVHSEPEEGTRYRTLASVVKEPGIRKLEAESPRAFLERILKMIVLNEEDPLRHAKLKRSSTSDKELAEEPFYLLSSIATRLSGLGLHLAVRTR